MGLNGLQYSNPPYFLRPSLIIRQIKGRIIGIETELPISVKWNDKPKEGDVVADVSGKAWLVVELCDSAMKSFADSEPSAPFEKMGRFEVNIGG